MTTRRKRKTTKRPRRRNPSLGPKPLLDPVDIAPMDVALDPALEPDLAAALAATAEPLTPEEMEIVPVAQGGGSLSYIPSSIALQIFGNAAGVAGALVGFALAYKVRNAKTMSLYETLIAAGTIVTATFGSVFFIRSFK